VYDPSGTLPLYNALVYVPSASLGAVASAPSCERCGAVPSGEPLAVTLSNARGEFVLSNVPSGTSVPLVVQVGKWRRQVVVPAVTACVDNPLDGSALTRLPRNRAEGDIPLIAMVTGHSDALECLLLKLGIDTAEFTTDAGAGRVHMYYGGAANTDGAGATSFAAELGQASFAHASTLWGNEGKLSGYDAVLLSCEGSQLPDEKDPYLANFKAFVDGGGRAWVGHTHSYWLRRGPDPLPSTAEYIGVGQALPEPFTLSVDTAFAKGAAFSEWLALVGATTTPGTLTLDDGEHSVAAAVPPTQRWLYASSNPNDPTVAVVEQLTFNTPVGAAAQSSCGRVLFTDNHVKAGGSGDDSDPEKPFPSGCSSQPLSAQQKAAAFALFDLLSCIQPDSVAPSPPSIP
jgi:hypothetical protein